jgi:hypothetical protein
MGARLIMELSPGMSIAVPPSMTRVWTIVATFACLGALMTLVAGAAFVARTEPLISQSSAASQR